jgi:hypothetical protein
MLEGESDGGSGGDSKMEQVDGSLEVKTRLMVG